VPTSSSSSSISIDATVIAHLNELKPMEQKLEVALQMQVQLDYVKVWPKGFARISETRKERKTFKQKQRDILQNLFENRERCGHKVTAEEGALVFRRKAAIGEIDFEDILVASQIRSAFSGIKKKRTAAAAAISSSSSSSTSSTAANKKKHPITAKKAKSHSSAASSSSSEPRRTISTRSTNQHSSVLQVQRNPTAGIVRVKKRTIEQLSPSTATNTNTTTKKKQNIKLSSSV
jgi:hypothetical protein